MLCKSCFWTQPMVSFYLNISIEILLNRFYKVLDLSELAYNELLNLLVRKSPDLKQILFHLVSVLSYHFLNEITFLSFAFSLSNLALLHFFCFLSKFNKKLLDYFQLNYQLGILFLKNLNFRILLSLLIIVRLWLLPYLHNFWFHLIVIKLELIVFLLQTVNILSHRFIVILDNVKLFLHFLYQLVGVFKVHLGWVFLFLD
jgi:hypothetical protein